MTGPLPPALAQISSQLIRMAERISRLERGQRAAQLDLSTIENGALSVTDAAGTVRSVIGLQADGSFAHQHFGAPPPVPPSAPQVLPGINGLLVTWDGTLSDGGAPLADFAGVQVHVSQQPGFLPSAATLQGTLPGAGVFPVISLTAGTAYYVTLVAVNTSGSLSDPSDQAGGTPDSVVAHIPAGALTASQVAFTARGLGAITTVAQPVPPASPQIGDLWYDTSNGNLRNIWNGSAWVPYQVGGAAVAANTIVASNIFVSYDAQVAIDGPAAWWPLDDPAGSGTAADASGGGNTGTAADVTFGQAPAVTSVPSASFNGVSGSGASMITTPYSPGTLTAFTVEVWVNLNGQTEAASFPQIISTTNSPGTSGGFQMFYNTSTGIPSINAGAGSGSSVGSSFTSQLPASGWVHLVATYDGHVITNYVNGVAVRTTAYTGAIPSPSPVIIGTNIGNTGNQYAGLLSEPAIYGYALPAARVAAHYAAQAGAIVASNIASDTITARQIAAGTITATEIAAGTITAALIAAGTITATQIASHTITAAQIAAGTITATEIAAGTITAALIAAGTITATQIASHTITAAQIAAGTITATEIAAGTITAALIAAGTITATQIASHTITAAQIAAGTITATEIAAGTITAALIAAGTITAAKLAAGIIVAGIVDGTIITGGTLVADGTTGQILVYSGTPASGNLIAAVSGGATTDAHGNTVDLGVTSYDNATTYHVNLNGSVVKWSKPSGPPIPPQINGIPETTTGAALELVSGAGTGAASEAILFVADSLYSGTGTALVYVSSGNFQVLNGTIEWGTGPNATLDTNAAGYPFFSENGLSLNVSGSKQAGANTANVTTTANTSLGFLTVPGGDVATGVTYAGHASGSFSTGSSVPSSATFKVYWGGIAGTIIASLAVPTIPASASGLGWFADFEANWMSTTQVEVTLKVGWHTGSGVSGSVVYHAIANTTGLSTTGSEALSMAFQWGTAPSGTQLLCDVSRLGRVA